MANVSIISLWSGIYALKYCMHLCEAAPVFYIRPAGLYIRAGRMCRRSARL